jgi:hypothetical protein
MRLRLAGSFALALVAAALLAPRPASAIPAFARKYRFSCTTCHASFPKLKPFGEAFGARGYRLEDPAQEPARATLDVGDDLLQLPRDFPVAARLEGFAAWNSAGGVNTDVQAPWVVKFLSGGPVADTVSYYVYFIIEQGEIVGLEDAFLQFNQVFGLPVDVIVGQFQVSDPIFKRELRLERLDYEILSVRVGSSPVNLTYDRGIVLATGTKGFDVVVQVVNGAGIGTGTPGYAFDSDPYKNVALRLAVEVGPVRLGAFGYYGKERQTSVLNEMFYLGPDLVADLGELFQVNAIYLERRDTNPFFVAAPGPRTATRGGFGELLCWPGGHDGRWVLSALYNRVASDDPAARRSSGALGASWLLRRNVRLVAEAARDLEQGATRVSLGTVLAF